MRRKGKKCVRKSRKEKSRGKSDERLSNVESIEPARARSAPWDIAIPPLRMSLALEQWNRPANNGFTARRVSTG
jgi:hypothetical protein